MRQWLEAIYRQHRQGLFALALSITGSPDTAEDAIQEAFAGLWRRAASRGKLPGFQPSGDKAAYFYAAVRNAACDQVRDVRPRNGVSLFNGRYAAPQTSAPLLDRETAAQLQAAVEALPEQQKQVLVMKIYGDLTFQQIAQVLDEPLTTVASRYQRTLAQLKTSLEDEP